MTEISINLRGSKCIYFSQPRRAWVIPTCSREISGSDGKNYRPSTLISLKKKKKKKAKPSLFIFYRVVVGNNRRREGEVAREKKFTGEPGECTIKFIITPGSMCRLAKGRVEGNGSTLSDGRKIYSLTGDKRVARHQGINKFRTTGCRTFCSSSIGISIRGHRSIRVALFLSHRQLSQPIYIIVHIKNA